MALQTTVTGTHKVEIEINNTKFTFQEDNEGRLVITKYDYSEGVTSDAMIITPGVSNQIKIK